MNAFLRLVEKKSGKPLSKTEQNQFSESLRHDAQTRKLVEPAAKANSYRLLLAGEDMLRREEPLEQQLERLRESHLQLVAHWRSVHQHIEEELTGLDGGAGDSVRTARSELQVRGEQVGHEFDTLLAELTAFPRLLSAARSLQAEQRRLTEQRQPLLQKLQEQREQLEAFERRMEERFHEWSLATRTVVESALQTHPAPRSTLDDASVWEATRRAADALKQETFRLGGIVKVPELTDAVRRSFSDLTPEVFHNLLKKWQGEDRLTLQLCNDPRLEPRAAEGIATPRGLLFYVQVH